MAPGRIGAVTLVLVIAVAALMGYDWFLAHRESPELSGRAVLGERDLSGARLVLIETAAGQVTLRRSDGRWVVSEQADFPADTARLRSLLLTLRTATLMHRSRPTAEGLADLGLLQKIENDWRFEPGRTAGVLSLIHGEEQRHRLIVQVLLGNTRPSGGTYVRYPGSNTAYLIAPTVRLEGRPQRWIDARLFPMSLTETASTLRVMSAGTAALALRRTARDAPWRAEATQAAGRQAPHLLRALEALRIHRIAAAASDAVSSAPVATITVRTFTDVRYDLRLHAAHPDAAEARVELQAVVPARASAAAARQAQQVAQFQRRFSARRVYVARAQAAPLLQIAASSGSGP